MTARRFLSLTLSVALILGAAGCRQNEPQPPPQTPAAPKGPTVTSERFGTMPDGTAVDIYTLRNANGVEVRAISYGGIITSLKAPDRAGTLADIVMGFD